MALDSGLADGGPVDGGPDGGSLDAGDAGLDGGVIDAGPDAGPASHRAWPEFPGGSAAARVSIVTIVAANDDNPTSLFAYSDALVTSGWWSALVGAYGVDGNPTSVHLTGPAITQDVGASDEVAYIEAVVADAGTAGPDGTRIYLLYLPSGISFADTDHCGHHALFPTVGASLGDEYAVVQQCQFQNMSTFDYQCITASHLIAEAATDATPQGYRLAPPPTPVWSGSVWQAVQPPTIEIGDLCVDTREREGDSPGFYYQRFWFNAAAADAGDPCIPGLEVPYFNVTYDQDWYSVSAGETVTIPVTGWSTAPRAPWFVSPHYVNGTLNFASGSFGLNTDLGKSDAGCGSKYLIDNGSGGSLQIDIPATATSGDWGVFTIQSNDLVPTDGGCFPPADQDANHWWPVGVYVQ
jgi:hypothetical protein